MTPIKPPALKKGDLIGLVSPASRIVDTSKIDRAVRYLETLGYRALVGEHALQQRGYLAGTDEERAADLHSMFEDRRVRAIFCIRGGYGAPRILPLLRYGTIARNPKIFVGYSDITALHLALWRKVSVVSFHGPMAGVDMADPMDPFSEEIFWHLLTSTRKLGPLSIPEPLPQAVVRGRGTGRLMGGNLALVCALVGTSYIPDFKDALLYLEDIGEDPYRIDRMLTQLRGASILRRAAGIITGHFTDCIPKDPTTPSLTLGEVLQEYLESTGKPSLSNVPFGHERRNITIPVGVRARMDSAAGTLEYLEAAVR